LSFSDLGLSPILCTGVATLGYESPTPVQAQAIPIGLQGLDLMAGAQTGTGKTAAFALPIIERLLVTGINAGPRRGAPGKPRALVLVPTRELAAQVHESFRDYGKQLGLISTTIFGGVGMASQIQALKRSLDVVVATPGRLMDHMQQRTVDLSAIEILTLDEADRMLDMGFIPAIRKILQVLPKKRQTLLFSATFMPEIKALAAQFMKSPVEIQIAAVNAVATTITHRVHPVASERKRELIVHLLSKDRGQTLIFCRTKHGSDRLCRHLSTGGFRAEAIHGNKSQNARTRSLQDFKSGKTRILVATDIAARGLDIEQLPMVINFDLPHVPQDYIHRIGRTGRAGVEGQAVSLVCREEQPLLRDIQGLIGRKIEIVPVDGFEAPESAQVQVKVQPKVTAQRFRPRRSFR
jgi:ATP-dependent RNA helicase RhlE